MPRRKTNNKVRVLKISYVIKCREVKTIIGRNRDDALGSKENSLFPKLIRRIHVGFVFLFAIKYEERKLQTEESRKIGEP
jgi:hypothetical protein